MDKNQKDDHKRVDCPMCKAGFAKIRPDFSTKVCPYCGTDNYMNAKRCKACKSRIF